MTRPYIIECPDCGNKYGSAAVHCYKKRNQVFVDQVGFDCTIIKVCGVNHEKIADNIIRTMT